MGQAAPESGPPTVETRQLQLRKPQPSDVDALFEIQGNADAMRHTYVAPDRDATARYLQAYAAHFSEDGFAPWTALAGSDLRVVGWGGLHKDPQAPHWGPEVSYFIHSACWGRGLATELVRAALQLAFETIGLAEVAAFTRPENEASQKVLTKSGFRLLHYVPELERDQYVFDRRHWGAA